MGIVDHRRNVGRRLLDRGEVRKRAHLVEDLLLGLGEQGLANQNCLWYAAPTRQGGLRQAKDAVPLQGAHRSTTRLTSE